MAENNIQINNIQNDTDSIEFELSPEDILAIKGGTNPQIIPTQTNPGLPPRNPFGIIRIFPSPRDIHDSII
jgi:hypothetical protein